MREATTKGKVNSRIRNKIILYILPKIEEIRMLSSYEKVHLLKSMTGQMQVTKRRLYLKKVCKTPPEFY